MRAYILIPALFILVGASASADSGNFHSAIQYKLESTLGRLSSQELDLKPINTGLLKDLGILDPESDCSISKGLGHSPFDSFSCPTSALSKEFDRGAGYIISGKFLRINLHGQRGDVDLTRLMTAATSLGLFVQAISRDPKKPVAEFCRDRSTEFVMASNIESQVVPQDYRIKIFEVFRDCQTQQLQINIGFFHSP